VFVKRKKEIFLLLFFAGDTETAGIHCNILRIKSSGMCDNVCWHGVFGVLGRGVKLNKTSIKR